MRAITIVGTERIHALLVNDDNLQKEWERLKAKVYKDVPLTYDEWTRALVLRSESDFESARMHFSYSILSTFFESKEWDAIKKDWGAVGEDDSNVSVDMIFVD